MRGSVDKESLEMVMVNQYGRNQEFHLKVYQSWDGLSLEKQLFKWVLQGVNDFPIFSIIRMTMIRKRLSVTFLLYKKIG